MAQLAERLLPIPDVCDLKLIIGKLLDRTRLLLTVEKTKITIKHQLFFSEKIIYQLQSLNAVKSVLASRSSGYGTRPMF